MQAIFEQFLHVEIMSNFSMCQTVSLSKREMDYPRWITSLSFDKSTEKSINSA